MADLFTDSERVNLLFKKILNKPCTSLARDFFQEPSIVSRNFVYPEDIVSVAIPLSAPADLLNLTDASLDDNGRCIKGSYAGKTSTTDPNIRYYHKIPLEVVVGTGGSSFQSMDASTSHPGGFGDAAGTVSGNLGVAGSYGRALQNSIPFNHAPDGTYGVTLYKDTMVAIPFGTAGGGWIVDARPGVVTFFQYGNVTGVGESNPVYISFYRYVGATGITGGGGGSGASEDAVNNFSARQIFTGGLNGSIADQLAAIQIDSRNVDTLVDGEMLDAIQIGGNFDNSWRICVVKTSLGSAFLIQTRQGGVWVSKTTLSSP